MMQVPQLNQSNVGQNKCKVFIDNLDPGIAEDYLYKKFKEECGKIDGIKINKEKQTQKSKGTAVITFSHADYAEEARKKFNGQVIIKNVIRVKPYLNIYEQDKQANVNIRNIDSSVTISKLEEIFSEYGNVTSIDIKLNENGQSLGYGYIQFEKKEDVDKLLEKIQIQPITINNKVLNIERFKSQSERQGDSKSLFFRAFAKPIQLDNPRFRRIYELGWQMIILNSFEKQGVHVASCFVKYDPMKNQPWCMVAFERHEDALDTYNECENNRKLQALITNKNDIKNLLLNTEIPNGIDGNAEYTMNEVLEFLDFINARADDPYTFTGENFFFNYMKSKHLNIDKRLLLACNIRGELDEKSVRDFFAKFGTIVRFTLRQNVNPKYKTRSAFIHYQTEKDSNTALSDVYEKKMLDDISKIFYDRKQQVTILVPASIRKELRSIQKPTCNDPAKHSSQQNKLIPQWQSQPMIQPFPMMPSSLPRYPNQGQFQPQVPPMNRPPFQGGQQIRHNKPQRQQQGPPRQFNPPFQQRNRPPFPGQIPQIPPYQTGPFQPQIPPQFQQQQYPPQVPFGQPQFQTPMPMQQQPIAPQVQFKTFNDVMGNMTRFMDQKPNIQRSQLGQLLLPKVQYHLVELGAIPEWAQRVTGMLIDEKQFEISEILQLFSDDQDLKDRVSEGVDLIKEEELEKSGQ